ncbi:hypothetical protein D6829_00920 [Candidatus Pacearchaeota archaeon]|nr:MAG: hypothetical protein D6829_00920 [Candidatus Pacearchaeota archaeon]
MRSWLPLIAPLFLSLVLADTFILPDAYCTEPKPLLEQHSIISENFLFFLKNKSLFVRELGKDGEYGTKDDRIVLLYEGSFDKIYPEFKADRGVVAFVRKKGPYDSEILSVVSAGPDGFFGSSDDVFSNVFGASKNRIKIVSLRNSYLVFSVENPEEKRNYVCSLKDTSSGCFIGKIWEIGQNSFSRIFVFSKNNFVFEKAGTIYSSYRGKKSFVSRGRLEDVKGPLIFFSQEEKIYFSVFPSFPFFKEIGRGDFFRVQESPEQSSFGFLEIYRGDAFVFDNFFKSRKSFVGNNISYAKLSGNNLLTKDGFGLRIRRCFLL